MTHAENSLMRWLRDAQALWSSRRVAKAPLEVGCGVGRILSLGHVIAD